MRLNWSVSFRRELLLRHQADVTMSARFPLEGCALRATFKGSVNDRLDHADLGNRDKRIDQHNPLRNTEARRVSFARLELREASLLVAIPRAAKEVLIGVFEIAQSLLQRLRIHLPQPGGCGLLFQTGEFRSKVVIRKGFAGFPEVFALAVQGPIPNKSSRARKMMKHVFLLGSRVKAIAIGCLDRSLHGSIIPEKMF